MEGGRSARTTHVAHVTSLPHEPSHYLQDTTISKAQGRFLWADLMLEVLKYRHTETDIRNSLDAAPKYVDDLIWYVLQAYRFNLTAEEVDKFNTIWLWVYGAIRSLTLKELDGALLRTLSSSCTSATLGDQIRDFSSPLLDLVRDDRLSISYIKTRDPARLSLFSALPDVTTVEFAHTDIKEYYDTQNEVSWVALETKLLKQCLEALVHPKMEFHSGSDSSTDKKASYAFQLYAAQYSDSHLVRVVKLLEEILHESMVAEDYSELLGLLYSTFNEEEVLQRWAVKVDDDVFDASNIMELTHLVRGCNQFDAPHLSKKVCDWMEACLASPCDMFVPLAKIHAKKALNGDWIPSSSLRLVIIKSGETAVICECCLYMYCDACIEKLDTPSLTRLCVPGHRVTPVIVREDSWFKGEEMRVEESVRLLRQDWGLE
jgi:hypothetical protein